MAADLERWEVKALCMFGLFGSMVIFVLLPICVSRAVERQGERGRFIISILSCFGGGVFFGAYLIHLNPEVREILHTAFMEPRGISYPVPEAFAGVGFFLILFLEKAILFGKARSDKKKRGKKNGFGKSLPDVEVGQYKPYGVNVRIAGSAYTNQGLDGTEADHTMIGRMFPTTESRSRSASQNSNKRDEDEKTRQGFGTDMKMDMAKALDAVSTVSNSSSSRTEESDEFDGGKERSVIFIVALSLDCIFEGLALGLMDNTVDVISLFVAIISHEFIMSFCIGLELVKYNSTKKVIAAGIMYAFTPVFGAIIGTAIREGAGTIENENTIDIVSGILQAISAGTFIYCSFIGILSEELTHDNGFWKALSTFVGFGLMAAMAAIPENTGGEVVDTMTTLAPMITTA